MRISTEINSIGNICGGQVKAVEILAKAGFDCFDFSMFDMAPYDWGKREIIMTGNPLQKRDTCLKHAEELKKTAAKYGMTCNQSHAPFPVCCKPILDYVPLAIEATAVAGGKICIVHPDNNKSAEENAVMYKELLKIAHKFDVKIATENMWNWSNELNQAAPAACSDEESFVSHIDVVGDPYLVACLDIGHAEMKGLNTSAVSLIKALDYRLQALHIHDNDRWHDNHELPFTMSIEYEPIVKALKEIDYKGDFTLESDAFVRNSGISAEEGAKKMAETARKLAEMFEN